MNSPDGKISVWIPNTWKETAGIDGIAFKDPEGKGTLFLGSSTQYRIDSVDFATPGSIRATPVTAVPGLTIYDGYSTGPGMGYYAITAYAGESTSPLNRGFGIVGAQGVEYVTYNQVWQTAPEAPALSDAEIASKVSAFRSSQTSQDVARILHSIRIN